VRHTCGGRAFYRRRGDDASVTLDAPADAVAEEKVDGGRWFEERWRRLSPRRGEEAEEAVAQLVGMGFEPAVVARALRAVGGDLARAVEWLFEHPDPDPDPAHGGGVEDVAVARRLQEMEAADHALAERLQREGSGGAEGGQTNSQAGARTEVVRLFEEATPLLQAGQFAAARDLLLRCRALCPTAADPQVTEAVLGNLGNAHQSLGDHPKAIEHHTAALAISREIGDRQGEGSYLGNLGGAHQSLGDSPKAIEHHTAALAIAREIGDRRGEGIYLGGLGGAHQLLGDSPKAIECHTAALAIAWEIGNRRGEGGDLNNLGVAHMSLGELGAARDRYRDAVAVFDGLRRELADGQRVTIFAEHAKAYRGLVAALVALGEHSEALLVAERGRSRALADLLERAASGEGGADLQRQRSAAEVAEAGLEWPAVGQLAAEAGAALVFYFVHGNQLLTWVVTAATASEAQLRFKSSPLPTDLGVAGLTGLVADFGRGVRGARGEASEAQPAAAALLAAAADHQPGKDAAEASLHLLDRAAAAERLRAALVAKNHKEKRRLLADLADEVHRDAARVEPLVAAALESDPALEQALRGLAEARAEEKVFALYEALVAPIEELLPPAADGETPRLVFVPHNELCRVPFGALMAREASSPPLLARYEVQVVNSLQVLRLTLDNATAEVELAAENALVVGYPTQDVPAVRLPWAPSEDIAVSRLRGAETEAVAVAAQLGATALIGSAATKAAVLGRLASAPVVHIATHGFVNEGGDDKTVLLLHGENGVAAFLGEEELDPAALRLSARLVVLPACHSGRGQQWTGEGLVGLGRALLACGAPTVLLSHWSLPDQQGAAVMRRFYALLADPAVHGGAMVGEAAALLRDAIMHVFPGEALRRRWMDWGALQVLGAGAIRLLVPRRRTVEQLVQVEVAAKLDELTVEELQELLAAKAGGGDDHRVVPRERFAEWDAKKARELRVAAGCSEEEAARALRLVDFDVGRATKLLGLHKPDPEPEPELEPDANLTGLLPTAELFEQMKQTRVLFSFGSANGGLDLAKRLRAGLLAADHDAVAADPEPTVHLRPVVTQPAPDGPAAEVYIDAVSLTPRTPGYRPLVRDGAAVRNAQGEAIGLNDHWAEYYFMGALLAHTVVLVLDGAWARSEWCQGELALFRENCAQAFAAAARRAFPGSEFRLVVVYEQRTYGSEGAARAKVAADFGAAVMGLGEPLFFAAWFDARAQFGIVGTGCEQAEHGDEPCAECAAARRCFCETVRRPPTLSTGAVAAPAAEADAADYCRLYDRHWRARARGIQFAAAGGAAPVASHSVAGSVGTSPTEGLESGPCGVGECAIS
jgi:CHAT domain-containing protein/tetratricopeptide (TPR) repeat protein